MRASVTVTFPALLQQQSSLTGANSDRLFPPTHDAFTQLYIAGPEGMLPARSSSLIHIPVHPVLPQLPRVFFP